VREHFDSVGCGTIYKTAGDGRVPLTAAQRKWTGLTDEDVYLLANEHLHYQTEGYEVSGVYNLARAIEAKLKENT